MEKGISRHFFYAWKRKVLFFCAISSQCITFQSQPKFLSLPDVWRSHIEKRAILFESYHLVRHKRGKAKNCRFLGFICNYKYGLIFFHTLVFHTQVSRSPKWMLSPYNLHLTVRLTLLFAKREPTIIEFHFLWWAHFILQTWKFCLFIPKRSLYPTYQSRWTP